MKPERLSLDPNSEDAKLNWRHWHKTFMNFLSKLKDVGNDDKLAILINYLSPDIYRHVSEAEGFDAAIETLKKLYVKPKNEIFARHLLATRSRGEYRPVLSSTVDPEQGLRVQERDSSGALQWVRTRFVHIRAHLDLHPSAPLGEQLHFLSRRSTTG
jgi:hypothetical protein